jgi:hypothetical protein
MSYIENNVSRSINNKLPSPLNDAIKDVNTCNTIVSGAIDYMVNEMNRGVEVSDEFLDGLIGISASLTVAQLKLNDVGKNLK